MGFYLRKSFGFGPFRLNLSKSGLGASFGVKGARIGINPKGRAYVHARAALASTSGKRFNPHPRNVGP